MHIEATTYTFEAAVSAYSSQKGTEESKRFEPAVLGAAENLPGQGPERSGHQVDQRESIAHYSTGDRSRWCYFFFKEMHLCHTIRSRIERMS